MGGDTKLNEVRVTKWKPVHPNTKTGLGKFVGKDGPSFTVEKNADNQCELKADNLKNKLVYTVQTGDDGEMESVASLQGQGGLLNFLNEAYRVNPCIKPDKEDQPCEFQKFVPKTLFFNLHGVVDSEQDAMKALW